MSDKKTDTPERVARRERQRRARERVREGRQPIADKLTAERASKAEVVAELKEARAILKTMAKDLGRSQAQVDNMADPRAPLDIDAFVNSLKSEDNATAGGASRSKRQEYNRLQGRFVDMLEDPSSMSEDEVRILARFYAATTEDEGRFVPRRAARLVTIQAAREALFLRSFIARATPMFHGKIRPSGFALRTPPADLKRINNLHVSDLHVGARLSLEEFPVASNPTLEARRIGAMTLETAEFKSQHREQTALHVYLNGDLIAGLLRHSNAVEEDPLTEQFTRVLHMLAQMLGYLAKHYPSIRVFCQSGNHGRNIQVHPGRATAQKWDSFETMIYVALKLACAALPNVMFEIPKTPYCAVPLFDNWALQTHGDTLINAGNPSKKLDVDSILKQINAINASKVYGHHFSVVIIGHVHTSVQLDFAGGTLIVNGAATPPNGFALSGGYYPACAQWLWESTAEHPVGDSRMIRLGASVDNDPTFERVITPVY